MHLMQEIKPPFRGGGGQNKTKNKRFEKKTNQLLVHKPEVTRGDFQ